MSKSAYPCSREKGTAEILLIMGTVTQREIDRPKSVGLSHKAVNTIKVYE